MIRSSASLTTLVAAATLGCGYITQSLVTRAVPEFPDLPGTTSSLSAGQSCAIDFETSTPFDLDVLLADVTPIATKGFGTLFLPDPPRDGPVPGMILLHGSGGISPGREMEYGPLLADPMQKCVESGRLIGRDDATKTRSDADLLAFLERVFGLD